MTKKQKKSDLAILLPAEISREVSLTQREKRKVKRTWKEEIITIPMPFGQMEQVNPLLFEIFPDLLLILLDRTKGDRKKKLGELLSNGIVKAFKSHMGAVKRLLSVTLEKPVEWFDYIEPSIGLELFYDWISLNKHMLTSSNGDNQTDAIKKK